MRKTLLGIILLLVAIGCVERVYGGQTGFGVGGGQWFGSRAEGKIGVCQLGDNWLSMVAWQSLDGRDVLGVGVAQLLPGEKFRPLISAAVSQDIRSGRAWEYLGVGLLWSGGRDWAVKLELVAELETGRTGLFVSQILFLQ